MDLDTYFDKGENREKLTTEWQNMKTLLRKDPKASLDQLVEDLLLVMRGKKLVKALPLTVEPILARTSHPWKSINHRFQNRNKEIIWILQLLNFKYLLQVNGNLNFKF